MGGRHYDAAAAPLTCYSGQALCTAGAPQPLKPNQSLQGGVRSNSLPHHRPQVSMHDPAHGRPRPPPIVGWSHRNCHFRGGQALHNVSLIAWSRRGPPGGGGLARLLMHAVCIWLPVCIWACMPSRCRDCVTFADGHALPCLPYNHCLAALSPQQLQLCLHRILQPWRAVCAGIDWPGHHPRTSPHEPAASKKRTIPQPATSQKRAVPEPASPLAAATQVCTAPFTGERCDGCETQQLTYPVAELLLCRPSPPPPSPSPSPRPPPPR